jgi:hypothetical protein
MVTLEIHEMAGGSMASNNARAVKNDNATSSLVRLED